MRSESFQEFTHSVYKSFTHKYLGTYNVNINTQKSLETDSLLTTFMHKLDSGSKIIYYVASISMYLDSKKCIGINIEIERSG